MANIDVNELTKEQIEKAMACETAEELIAAAKDEGVELTREEAEAYLAELADFELDDEMIKNAAGGNATLCIINMTPHIPPAIIKREN